MAITFAGHDEGYLRITTGIPSTSGLWEIIGFKPDSPMPNRFQALGHIAAWTGPGSPTAHVFGIDTDGKLALFANYGTGATGNYGDGIATPIGSVAAGEWNFVAIRCSGGNVEIAQVDLGTETITKASVGQTQFTPTELRLGGAGPGESFEGKMAPVRYGSGSLTDSQLIAQCKSLTAVAGQGTVVSNMTGLGDNLAEALQGDVGPGWVLDPEAAPYIGLDSDAPQVGSPGGPGGPEPTDNVFEIGGSLDLRPQATIDAASADGQTVTANGIAASYDPGASVIAQLVNASTGNVVTGVTLDVTVDGDTWAASAAGVPEGTYRVRLIVADEIGSVTQESATFQVDSVITAPGAPTLDTATVLGPYSVKLEWTLADSAELEVRVYRKNAPGGARALVATLPPGTDEYTVTGLLAAETYYFDIGAWNTAGETRSNEKSATTMASSTTAVLSVMPTALAQPGTVTATLANPADSTLTSATFFKNGVAVGPAVTSSPFSVQIGLDERDNGQVVISATGVDELSRTVHSSPVTVTVAIEIIEEPEPGEEDLTDEQILDLLANPIDPKYEDEAFPYGFDFRSELQTGERLSSVEYVQVQVRGPDEIDPDKDDMLEGDPIMRPALGVVVQRVKAGKPGVAYYLRCQVRTSLDRLIDSELQIRVHATTGRRAVRL